MWRVFRRLPEESRSLLQDHYHKPNGQKDGGWEKAFYDFQHMSRWIAAYAVLQGCSGDEAADAIHALPARRRPPRSPGSDNFYQFDTIKSNQRDVLAPDHPSKLQGVFSDAFFISQKTTGDQKTKKDRLESFAAADHDEQQQRRESLRQLLCCPRCNQAVVPVDRAGVAALVEGRWACRRLGCPGMPITLIPFP